jgi:hypothetical protein
MKYCHEQALEIIKKKNPSIAEAIALAELAVQEEASIIAAAFFSPELRDACLSQLQIPLATSRSWFELGVVQFPDIQTIDELKMWFKDSVQGIHQALGVVINKSNNPQTTRLIEEVTVAIAMTTWINQLGFNPDTFSLLPNELIHEFTLNVEEIKLSKKVPEGLARALAVLMGEARQSFVRLYHHLNEFDAPLRLAVYTGVKFHEALLDEIIWAKFELFSSIQEVSSLRRRFMIFKAKRAMRKLG